MKIALIILSLFLLSINVNAQNKITVDSLGRKILVGVFSWVDWNKEMNWKIPQDYCINLSNCAHLADLINKKKISFLIFAGSWCGDTKSELPKIIKIFQSCEIPKYEIIGVDRAKYEPSMRFVEYNIERVPTLVILSDRKEIGRIIEYPKKDWFEDILEIIENK